MFLLLLTLLLATLVPSFFYIICIIYCFPSVKVFSLFSLTLKFKNFPMMYPDVEFFFFPVVWTISYPATLEDFVNLFVCLFAILSPLYCFLSLFKIPTKQM